MTSFAQLAASINHTHRFRLKRVFSSHMLGEKSRRVATDAKGLVRSVGAKHE